MFFALSIPKLYYCLKNFLCKFRYRQTVPQNLVLKIKTPCMSSNFGADQSACFVQIYESSGNLLPLYFLCSVSEMYLNFSCSYTFVLLLRPAKVNMLVCYCELRPAYWSSAKGNLFPRAFPSKIEGKALGTRLCERGIWMPTI